MKMKWPPIKSWTRKKSIWGYKHFVAINYGGINAYRWVNLVSVLNGDARLKISWDELINPSLWVPGWQHSEEEDNEIFENESNSYINIDKERQSCLHPSSDSGFSLPFDHNSIRLWF